jgi:REP element-mobilizing transposase RayT
MPRRARIDAPGALHHVICRGIERRKIFWEDSDREDFIERLESTLSASQTACYVWALLPNHFHLLLRTGNTPIARVMRQLLSGYAGRFNRLHRRSFKTATNPFCAKKSRTCWSWCATFI